MRNQHPENDDGFDLIAVHSFCVVQEMKYEPYQYPLQTIGELPISLADLSKADIFAWDSQPMMCAGPDKASQSPFSNSSTSTAL